MSLPSDLSWNEIAGRVGVEPPMLAPGDHPMDIVVDAQMYWPVDVNHPLQETRP